MQEDSSTGQAGPPTNASATKKNARADLPRHQRKCTICQHSAREQIEQEYLDWVDAEAIAEFYNVTRRAIYRHASVVGLRDRRNRKVRFTLSHFLEHASTVRVTASSIVEAVKVYTHLTDDGQFIRTPKPRTVKPDPDSAVGSSSNSEPADPADLIDTACRAGHAATA